MTPKKPHPPKKPIDGIKPDKPRLPWIKEAYTYLTDKEFPNSQMVMLKTGELFQRKGHRNPKVHVYPAPNDGEIINDLLTYDDVLAAGYINNESVVFKGEKHIVKGIIVVISAYVQGDRKKHQVTLHVCEKNPSQALMMVWMILTRKLKDTRKVFGVEKTVFNVKNKKALYDALGSYSVDDTVVDLSSFKATIKTKKKSK